MSDTIFIIVLAIAVALSGASLLALWNSDKKLKRWKELQLKVDTEEGLTADEWEELEKISRG